MDIGRIGLGRDGKFWRSGTEVYGNRDILSRDVISRKLSVPHAERIFFIPHFPFRIPRLLGPLVSGADQGDLGFWGRTGQELTLS